MTFGVVAEKLPLATTIVFANIKIDLRRQYRRQKVTSCRK